MTPEDQRALAALRAKPSSELTKEDIALAVRLQRDGRRLAHDISAAAAAKKAPKPKRMKKEKSNGTIPIPPSS